MYIKAINSTWNHKCKRVKCLLAHRLTRKKICTVTRQGTTVTILKPAWCLSRLNKIHNYCCFFPDQWRAWTVCVCVCVCVFVCVYVCVCVYNIISLLVQGNDIIPHTHTYMHTTQRTDIALLSQGQCLQFILFYKITLSQCLTISPSLPFPSLPLAPSPPLLPPLPLSLLLYVSMAERDQGQLRLVLSVQRILWKQYITGNSCQSTSPSICVTSPSSLHPSC